MGTEPAPSPSLSATHSTTPRCPTPILDAKPNSSTCTGRRGSWPTTTVIEREGTTARRRTWTRASTRRRSGSGTPASWRTSASTPRSCSPASRAWTTSTARCTTGALALKIQHPDNPPLFAWAEEEYVRHTGDLGRVEWLLRSGYLQRHFEFFETVAPGSVFGTATSRPSSSGLRAATAGTASAAAWTTHRGLHSRAGAARTATSSGSTPPRSRPVAARSIARLARQVGDEALASEYDDRHRELGELVNDFWDDGDGIYYDRVDEPPYEFRRVRTPAAYWPLLAGVCDAEQADALAARLTDPDCFGGPVPWPSVARDDPAYRPTGHYWRGGVWVPNAYVAARALADNGHAGLAHAASLQLVRHLARTYADYQPATIWEAYSPERPTPSTAKDDAEIARPDFCGWSALAPIAMLIDTVSSAPTWRTTLTSTVHYRRHLPGRTGIRNLRVGDTRVTVIADDTTLTVSTNSPITLALPGPAPSPYPRPPHTLREEGHLHIAIVEEGHLLNTGTAVELRQGRAVQAARLRQAGGRAAWRAATSVLGRARPPGTSQRPRHCRSVFVVARTSL